MFLKNSNKDYRFYIGIGSLCLSTGIVLTRVLKIEWIENVLIKASAFNILWMTFSFISGVLLGVSIVFNIKGIFLYRNHKY